MNKSILDILCNPKTAIKEIEDLIEKLNLLLIDLKKSESEADSDKIPQGIVDVVKVKVIKG